MSVPEQLQWAAGHAGPGLYLVLAVIAAELINLVTFRKLNALGIVPRDADSVPGIFLAPLLHENLGHFFANLLPLCVLSLLLGKLFPSGFWWVVLAIALGSGLLVWLLARRAVHIGASGLVYGLFGFLALHGFLSGQLLYLAISIGLLMLYSGILWGALPTAARSSWESHLAGLAVGLGLAWLRLV
ncbi:MAG: rhomboid family intramembrane serine protease [Pseudomonadota bacterium]